MITSPLTRVRVRDMCLFGYHGVLPEEKRLGQRFYVSIDVAVDLTSAIADDEYASAVCYGALCKAAEDVFQKGALDLIETVAARIAETVLVRLEQVHEVKVEVRKPSAPLPYAVSEASVEVTRQREYTVGFSLGANLGEREAVLMSAVQALGRVNGIEIEAVSSFYDSAPWGVEDQPAFVNICAVGRTILLPEAILTVCKDIEYSLGRVPGRRWGERVVDIDILFHGTSLVDHPLLSIPHKHLFERAFVLEPLVELNSVLEVAGRSVSEALAELERTPGDVVRRGVGQVMERGS